MKNDCSSDVSPLNEHIQLIIVTSSADSYSCNEHVLCDIMFVCKFVYLNHVTLNLTMCHAEDT